MNNIEGFEPIPFGKYLLIEKIGVGGMAEIFKAKTFGVSGFEKVLVIKKILPKYSTDEEFREMFINEAKLTAGLLHNNVVQIYELGEINKNYFIAMEYIFGKDLLQLLRKSSKRREYIPTNIIIFVLKEIFTGLGYAHKATDEFNNSLNIIHRDVSPSNILISYNGVVKVSDFGIAKTQIKGSNQTKTGQFKGKLGYMSPEQVLGGDIDSRSDLFAGGIIAYELLTLTRLFQGSSDIEILNKITNEDKLDILKVNPSVPQELAIIINKILEKDPNKRYQNAEQIVEALDEVAYTNNLRMTRSKFSEFLNNIFEEEIKEAQQKIKTGKTSYLYAKEKYKTNQTDKAVSGYVTYIPKVDKTGQDNSKIYLEQGRYVVTDVNDAYYINDGVNPIIGPITLGSLVTKIKEKKITGKEFFSKDGIDFKIVDYFPEIKALISMHSTISKKEGVPVYSANLSNTSFVRLLYKFYTKKITGLVKLGNQKGIKKEIIFKKGLPVFIKSNKKSELLGNFLLKSGHIKKEELDKALRVMGNHNNKLGEALIAQKILQPFEVFELLSKQVKEKIYEIFTWMDGDFDYYNEFNMVSIVVPITINFYETILNGLINYYPKNKLIFIFSKKSSFKIVKKENKNINLASFKFPSTYYKVFKGIEFDKTISQNLEKLKYNEKQKEILYQLLYLLYEIEAISLVQ